MNRRRFLSACAISGASIAVASKPNTVPAIPNDIYRTIDAVQQHMFPGNGSMPSAKDFKAADFLAGTVMHHTYDKDIREFVLEGAAELQNRENGNFLKYDEKKKETALREYEKTVYGSGWLDRIMLLSLEAMLSDPIYGGNFRESGWKSLGTKGGEPRPSVRYAGV